MNKLGEKIQKIKNLFSTFSTKKNWKSIFNKFINYFKDYDCIYIKDIEHWIWVEEIKTSVPDIIDMLMRISNESDESIRVMKLEFMYKDKKTKGENIGCGSHFDYFEFFFRWLK